MKTTISLLSLIAMSAIICSCKSTKEILPGFKLYEAPNGIDKPGRVFRLDNDSKTDFLVEYLDINPQPAPIVIKEKEQSKNLEIATVIDFLSSGQDTWSADVSGNFKKKTNFNFKLGDAQIYKISDADLRTIIPDLRKRLLDDIKLFGHKKPEYFIVREAVTAKDILITMDKKTSVDNFYVGI